MNAQSSGSDNRLRAGKKDLCIVLLLLLLGAVLFFVFHAMKSRRGTDAQIRVGGVVVEHCALDENRSFPIATEHGNNLICVENGHVYMQEADCPDHYCMRQGRISHQGETIVCLPHRLVIEIVGADKGDEEDEIDVIAQ